MPKVRDIMSSEVESASPDTTLEEVATMMKTEDVGAIPVVEDDELVGIVTDRDIAVRVVAKGQDPYTMRAGDCMSSVVFTVREDALLSECVLIMQRQQVRRVVVVDAAGRVCGIVAQADVAESAPRVQTRELLRQVSEPSAQPTDAAYH